MRINLSSQASVEKLVLNLLLVESKQTIFSKQEFSRQSQDQRHQGLENVLRNEGGKRPGRALPAESPIISTPFKTVGNFLV